ncbi:hypothetical protein [Dactylosporangium sp. CA-139066]|uniref:hypothetical protein n=1 Tax=Dactylosporangium sp. CA-139066 TaxID=3239930 RepID=UPI003D9054B8
MQPVATGRGEVAPGPGGPGTPGRATHGLTEGGDADARFNFGSELEEVDGDGDWELPGVIADLNAVVRRRDDEPVTGPHGRLAFIAFKTLGAFLLLGLVGLTLVAAIGKPGELLLDFLKFSLVPLFGLITFIAGFFFGKRSNIE